MNARLQVFDEVIGILSDANTMYIVHSHSIVNFSLKYLLITWPCWAAVARQMEFNHNAMTIISGQMTENIWFIVIPAKMDNVLPIFFFVSNVDGSKVI